MANVPDDERRWRQYLAEREARPQYMKHAEKLLDALNELNSTLREIGYGDVDVFFKDIPTDVRDELFKYMDMDYNSSLEMRKEGRYDLVIKNL